jgi:GT2 family glycosyltransferase
VLVLDDASEPALEEADLQQAAGRVPLRLLRTERRLGVAGGRNRLMAAARGAFFCVLDDDAYFEAPGALVRMSEAFDNHPDVGILAFKIVDHVGGRTRPLTPHARRTLQRHPGLVDRDHYVSYYLGGGHALRRTVLARCGPYHEALVFGYEELDLAFRALEAGFKIRYQPEVVVHHRAEPSALLDSYPARTEMYYLLRNRLWMAYRYLPLRYLPTYVAASAGIYGVQAARNGAWKAYFRAFADGLAGLKALDRSPVGAATVQYLKTHHGRLWY